LTNGLHILGFSPFDPWHLLVIGVVALLLFGKRLPEVGRSLGRGIAEFKKGLREVQEELDRDEPEPPPREKLKPPADEGSPRGQIPAGPIEPDDSSTRRDDQP